MLIGKKNGPSEKSGSAGNQPKLSRRILADGPRARKGPYMTEIIGYFCRDPKTGDQARFGKVTRSTCSTSPSKAIIS